MTNSEGHSHRYHEDPNSGSYDWLSEKYADLWREHAIDENHYENVRSALLGWFLRMEREDHISPDSGSVLLAGPGFDVANREFGTEMIRNITVHHPSFVVADFSREVLDNAFRSFAAIDGRIKSTIKLVRRDLSHGLSAKLESIIKGRLARIEEGDIDGMERLMDDISRGIISVETVEKHSIDSGESREGQPDVESVITGEGADFRQITEEVYAVVANLLLTGMFAKTESTLRNKLLSLSEMEMPSGGMTVERIRTHFGYWHELICKLNTEAAIQFYFDLLEAHPNVRIFATLDDSVTYEGMDRFPRLDVDDIRTRIMARGISTCETTGWKLRDFEENPPHSHSITVLEAIARGDDIAHAATEAPIKQGHGGGSDSEADGEDNTAGHDEEGGLAAKPR